MRINVHAQYSFDTFHSSPIYDMFFCDNEVWLKSVSGANKDP